MRAKIADLVPGTGYAVQVRAEREGSYSEWSERFLLTTDENLVQPAAPTSVTWVVSDDAFVASWAPVTTSTDGSAAVVTAYELEFTASGTTKIITVPQKTGGNLTYTLTFSENVGLFGTPRPSIDFRVRAVNNKSVKGAFSSTITATNPKPTAPTNFTATAMTDAVELKWDASPDTDLAGYNVYVGTPTGFTPGAGNKIFFGLATRTLYRTTTYSEQFFKVRAVDKFGQESDLPDPVASATPSSPFGGDTTPPATPTGLAATLVTSSDASNTVANVTWNANSEPDLADYRIRYRKAGDTNWSHQIVGGDTTATTIRSLDPYVNYEFQIQAVDFAANESAFTSTATGSGASNSNPSQPQAPGASSNTQRIQVTPTGLRQFDGTAMEADVEYYEVYALNTNASFTPGPTNQLGVIPVGPAMAATFQIPTSGGSTTETWYVKVIAVDTGGLKGSASPAATATPGLIGSTNIVDASITNAKIFDLAANKITAGTGIINDITVKSKLTLGDASNVGYIETYDYTNSGGATGAQFSKNGIIIKTGAIEAPALRIQIGQNIMPYAWATMDTPYSSRPLAYIGTGTLIPSTSTTDFMHGTQSLKANVSGTIPLDMVMSDSTTNDNIVIPEQGAQWIISMWVKSPTTNMPTISVRSNNVSQSSVSAKRVSDDGTSLVVNTWTRIYIVTSALNVSKGQVRVSLNGTGDWYFDSVQMEKLSPGNTSGKPSTWYPPALTSIDGGMIKTGEIRSTNNSGQLDANGNPEPVWSIPLNGAATFSAMRVLGNTVLGNGPLDGTSLLSSSNFMPGKDGTGWQLKASGEATFKQVTADGFKGAIIARNNVSTSEGYGSTVELNESGFFVRGSNAKGNPEYITFPTSGAPNIISGTLKAETMSVSGLLDPITGITQGASFRGISHYELGSELMLDNAISRPLTPPTATMTVPKQTFTGAGNGLIETLAYDAGKFYRVENLYRALDVSHRIHRFSSTGVFEVTLFPTKPPAPPGGDLTYAEIESIVKIGSYWYILWNLIETSSNTSLVSQHDGTTWAYTGLSAEIANFGHGNGNQQTMGKDATNLLICSWNSNNLDGTTRQPVIRHFNPTTLAVTGTDVTCTSYPSATSNSQKGGTVTAVLGGEFDYGAGNKTYLLGFNYGQEGARTTLYAYNSSGVYQQTRIWTLEAPTTLGDGIVYTADYNTAGGVFYHVNYDNDFYKYGPETWTTESPGWGFGYSWYTLNGRTVVATTTAGSAVVNALAGVFQPSDVGADISGANFGTGKTIVSIATDGSQATLNSGTGVTAGTNINMTISYETDISPLSQIVASKRRTFTLTGAVGPIGTVMRPYIGRGTAPSSYPLPTQMNLQGTLAAGIITYTTDDVNFTGAAPKTASTFLPGTPSRVYTQQLYSFTVSPVTTVGSPVPSATITGTGSVPVFGQHMVGALVSGTGIPANTRILSVSADRISAVMSNAATANNGSLTLTLTAPSIEMKGDGFLSVEKLYARQTILTSTQDVNALAQNAPPLRIGDINGDHLRMDGNEIQAMDDDDTAGNLIINQAGGTIKLGKGSQAFTSIDMGFRALSAGPGGQDNIPHTLNGTPDVVVVMPFTTGAFRHVQVTARSSTNFTVQVMDAAGANVANSTLQVFWIAVLL